LPSKDPTVNDEVKWLSCRPCDNSGLLGFKVKYRGEEIILTPEQALAAFLTKIQTTAKNDGCKDTTCVVAIPGW
jgi:hypothetical protein